MNALMATLGILGVSASGPLVSATLAGTTVEVIRPLMQGLRDDGLLVPCRAAQLSWETTSAVLECRYATGSMKPADLAKAQNHFARMTPENAKRTLRFWQVRAS